MATAVGLLHEFDHPWAVSMVELNSFGQSLDGGDGVGNVDGDPATGQGSVGDVEVAVGFGEYGIHP